LPGGRASGDPLKVVHTDAAHPDRAAIERTIEQQTGLTIRLDDPPWSGASCLPARTSNRAWRPHARFRLKRALIWELVNRPEGPSP